jgi:hypothetical protein
MGEAVRLRTSRPKLSRQVLNNQAQFPITLISHSGGK